MKTNVKSARLRDIPDGTLFTARSGAVSDGGRAYKVFGKLWLALDGAAYNLGQLGDRYKTVNDLHSGGQFWDSPTLAFVDVTFVGTYEDVPSKARDWAKSPSVRQLQESASKIDREIGAQIVNIHFDDESVSSMSFRELLTLFLEEYAEGIELDI